MRQADVAAATRALLGAAAEPREAANDQAHPSRRQGRGAHGRRLGQGRRPQRTARAEGFVAMAPATLALIASGDAKKGDVLATARIAGIMAAKRTHELIPLCHPLAIDQGRASISSPSREPPGMRVTAEVKVAGQTGVEMEALTAVSVACLTIYDMLKAADRGMRIGGIRLVEKTGGRSGTYRAADRQGLVPWRSSPSKRPGPHSRGRRRRSEPRPSAIEAARGRVLAAPLAAQLTQPPFDASAMDGYAVRAADVATLPATLARDRRGAGRAPFRRQRRTRARPCASSPARRCPPAPTPSSSRRTPSAAATARSRCARLRRAGPHPRRAASISRQGDVLLAAGRRLGPREIALAAAMGHARAAGAPPPARCHPLHRRRTGARPAAAPGPGQIVVLQPSRRRRAGRARRRRGRAARHRRATRARAWTRTLARGGGADMLVTIGGASVGDHDLVAPVLAARGMALDFWKIAMRPGKPLMFGRLGPSACSACPATRSPRWCAARMFLVPLMRAPARAVAQGARGADAGRVLGRRSRPTARANTTCGPRPPGARRSDAGDALWRPRTAL